MPFLPQGQSRVHVESTCPTECLSKLTGNITVFGSFPHMHSYGREIWTTLYRGSYQGPSGELVTPAPKVISHKQYWNFDFQTHLKLNVVLTEKDRLSTHCVYDVRLKLYDLFMYSCTNNPYITIDKQSNKRHLFRLGKYRRNVHGFCHVLSQI